MISSDINYATFPALIIEIELSLNPILLAPRNVVLNTLPTSEYSVPVSLTSSLKLAVCHPLTTDQVTQYRNMGWLCPPVQSPVYMCEVIIVAEKVHSFAQGL